MKQITDKIKLEKSLLLAPMEDITDIPFRLICKELGADIVYTEFVNSEGLVRQNEKTHNKLRLREEERPVGIQIYGDNIKSMVGAAVIAESENPDIIDINAGCWVKKVAGRGAGAGLLKDLPYLTSMVKEIVNTVKTPVTVKTRIGWDEKSIQIVELAQMLEDVGIKALTVHCRTRSQAHDGIPEWSWINRIKEKVSIPIILNGGIFTPEDVKKAFDETDADGIMLARGAIQNPWLFEQSKSYLNTGEYDNNISNEKRIKTALKHLGLSVKYKGEKKALIEFRKFYSGYLKGMYNASKTRQELMKYHEYNEVELCLLKFLEEINNHEVV
ncbi:MAG: tRNA dihydrouridine synthase DusB [Melioribacteraceae bacterium]|nr:tRNA dihydrouridine synthase DusB [Melioribacteraceae bacterium]